MKISKKDWQNYITRLRKVNEKAASKVADYMRTHDCNTSEGMKALIEYAHAVATKYGEGAAELSCQMLDEVSSATKARVRAAEPAATATYAEIAKTIYGTMATTQDPDAIGAAVGRTVKLASVDTLQQNALRDGAEWAWIPSGDTCAFCLMLASRGWVRASRKAIKNGHADHIHNNCDCTYCVRYDGKTTVEGYDPNRLYEEYQAAGNTPNERLNALRRQHYAANKDYINAQKRAAYFQRTAGDERLRRVHFGKSAEFESDYGVVRATEIKNAGNKVLVADGVELSRKDVREADRLISTAKKIHGAGDDCDIPFVIVDSDVRLAAYNPRTNTFFISKDLLDEKKREVLQKGFACADDPNSTLIHELFHWKDAEAYRKKHGEIIDATATSEYTRRQNEKALKRLIEEGVRIESPHAIKEEIGEYAFKMLLENNFEEVYTEFRTKQLLRG